MIENVLHSRTETRIYRSSSWIPSKASFPESPEQNGCFDVDADFGRLEVFSCIIQEDRIEWEFQMPSYIQGKNIKLKFLIHFKPVVDSATVRVKFESYQKEPIAVRNRMILTTTNVSSSSSWSQTMFPLIVRRLCAQRILCVQNFRDGPQFCAQCILGYVAN